MGWDALDYWGKDASLLERLTGGIADDVWTVRVGGQLAVARLEEFAVKRLAEDRAV